MLFKRSLLALLVLFCVSSLYSQGIEFYTSDSIAVGKVSQFMQGTMGRGVNFTYQYDFNHAYVPVLDFIVRIEHANNFLSTDIVSSWQSVYFSAGAQANFTVLQDWKFLERINVNPELSLGFCTHTLRPKTLSRSAYTDFLLNISCSCIFVTDVLSENGLSLVITPYYRLLPEKHNAGQFLGFTFGIKLKLFGNDYDE